MLFTAVAVQRNAACKLCGVALEYATVYGGAGFRYSNLEEAGNAAYTALIVLKSSIAAIILSIIGCLPLYGFGIIVEKAENSLAASKVEAVISEEKDEIQ